MNNNYPYLKEYKKYKEICYNFYGAERRFLEGVCCDIIDKKFTNITNVVKFLKPLINDYGVLDHNTTDFDKFLTEITEYTDFYLNFDTAYIQVYKKDDSPYYTANDGDIEHNF